MCYLVRAVDLRTFVLQIDRIHLCCLSNQQLLTRYCPQLGHYCKLLYHTQTHAICTHSIVLRMTFQINIYLRDGVLKELEGYFVQFLC